MIRRIDISHKTIFFIASFVGLLWLLYQIKDVIILVFIAVIFMSGLSPAVEKMTKWRVPKALAIAILYVIILGLLTVLISLIITPLVTQTSNLIVNLPATIERLAPANSIDNTVIQDQVGNISRNALTFTLAAFSNFLGFISIAVLTFYLLLDKERLYKSIIKLFPGRREKVATLLAQMEEKLGFWLRGQIILSLIIGALSYLLLLTLNVPYALPLAILAGVMEVVPVIGPIISAVPAILIAFVASPALAALVAVGFFVIQQAENHFIVPQVMRKAVGLNPLIVIIAIAVGGKLLGVAGALLAVPVAVVVQVVSYEIMNLELDIYNEKEE